MSTIGGNPRYKLGHTSLTDLFFDNITDSFERRLDAIIDKDDNKKKDDDCATKDKIQILLKKTKK